MHTLCHLPTSKSCNSGGCTVADLVVAGSVAVSIICISLYMNTHKLNYFAITVAL